MDAVLLQRWIEQRDAEAFRSLAMKHLPMVYATSLRILRDPAEAEDVAQECFEALSCLRDSSISYIGPWLHRVATNKSLNTLRSRARRLKREHELSLQEHSTSGSSNDEIYALVDEAIARLPEDLRLPLISHFLENETHESIAARLGVTRSAVTHRIARAIERVRVELKGRERNLTPALIFGALETIRLQPAAMPGAIQHVIAKLAIGGGMASTGGMATVSTGVALKGALLMTTIQKAGIGVAIAIIGIGGMYIARQQYGAPPAQAISNTASPSPKQEESPATQISGPQPMERVKMRQLAATQSDQTSALTTGGRISGVVVDVTGVPKVGVIVHAISPAHDGGGFSSETSAAGEFEIKGLPKGRFGLRLQMPFERVPERAARVVIELGENQHVDGLRVFAGDTGLGISGKVTDTQGNPIKLSHVQILGSYSDSIVQVNELGEYRISGLTPGVYSVGAGGHEKMFAKREDVPAGSENINFVLEDAATVQGRVLDAVSRTPIKDFRVVAVHESLVDSVNYDLLGLLGTHPFVTKVQDDGGQFQISHNQEGLTTVIAQGEGKLVGTASVTVVAGQRVPEVEILLENGLSVSGKVVGADGRPVQDASVYYGGIPQPIIGNVKNAVVAKTGPDGAFQIDGLAEGNHYLEVLHKLHGKGRAEFAIDGEAPPDLEIVLGGFGNVVGRVTRNGEPIAGMLVSAAGSMNERTGADGRFRIELVETGRISVQLNGLNQLMLPNAPEVMSKRIVVEAGKDAEADFDIPIGSGVVTGRVVSNETKPQNIHLNATYTSDGSIHRYAVKVSGDGTYKIENLPEGPIQLNASYHDQESGESKSRYLNFNMPDGGELEYDILFEGGSVATFDVSDFMGPEGASVHLYRGAIQFNRESFVELYPFLVSSGHTRERETIEIHGLEPGTYTAVLRRREGMGEEEHRQLPLEIREGANASLKFTQ